MTSNTDLLHEILALKKEISRLKIFTKETYTIKEAAIAIGVSYSHLQKLVAAKKISHSKPTGKLIFIQKSDLESFILKNHVSCSDDEDTFSANFLLGLKNKKW